MLREVSRAACHRSEERRGESGGGKRKREEEVDWLGLLGEGECRIKKVE